MMWPKPFNNSSHTTEKQVRETRTDLGTEVEIAEKNRAQGTGHNEENEYDEQISKHVVHLM